MTKQEGCTNVSSVLLNVIYTRIVCWKVGNYFFVKSFLGNFMPCGTSHWGAKDKNSAADLSSWIPPKFVIWSLQRFTRYAHYWDASKGWCQPWQSELRWYFANPHWGPVGIPTGPINIGFCSYSTGSFDIDDVDHFLVQTDSFIRKNGTPSVKQITHI